MLGNLATHAVPLTSVATILHSLQMTVGKKPSGKSVGSLLVGLSRHNWLIPTVGGGWTEMATKTHLSPNRNRPCL